MSKWGDIANANKIRQRAQLLVKTWEMIVSKAFTSVYKQSFAELRLADCSMIMYEGSLSDLIEDVEHKEIVPMHPQGHI